MTFWILVMAVVVLVVLSLVRERFEPTSTVKAPPYDDQEKVRIYSMLSRASGGVLMNKAKLDLPNETDDTKLAAKAAGYITPALESFYTTVYRPGTSTLKSANVDTFMQDRTGPLVDIEKEAVTAYFVNQAGIATSGYLDVLANMNQTATYQEENDHPPPICPTGTILRSEDKKCVSQTATGTLSCPTGYQLDETICRRIGGTETTNPTCPAGFAYNSVARVCDSIPVDPTCPGDFEYRGGACKSNTGTGTSTGFSLEYGPAPTCPEGTQPRVSEGITRCYEPTLPYQCAYKWIDTGGSGDGTPEKPCKSSEGTEIAAPTCPMGSTYNPTLKACDPVAQYPVCPPDYATKTIDGRCARTKTSPPAAPVSNTSGGSSTSTWGPTTGGASSRIRQVFGPQFTERGNQVNGGGDGDSSQSNIYPELLGGMIDSSSRIPGAGITAPSKNWTLANNGSLPNSAGLGADEMSRYFPFSRSPGDMDVIPDPYRVAQTFSASSYSSKTEPVPFLTDFSAFQK